MTRVPLSLPLRLPPELVRAGGALLILIGLATPVLVRLLWHIDLGSRNWQNFQAAGATVGTPDLLDPQRHAAWQISHHLAPQIFAYPPAVAWFYAPFAYLPAHIGLAINAIAVVAACALAALLAARAFSFSESFALLAVFAWQPALDSIWSGENGAIALLLAVLIVWAIAGRRSVWAGLAAGALFFKPSIAVAFVLLLIARRDWRALGVTAAAGVVWYFASVAATAGDWVWPVHYVHALSGYYETDFRSFAVAAMSVPTILLRLGVSTWAASLASILLLLVSASLFYRRPAIESASMAGFVAVAASPHAWGYDAALVLPALFFAMKNVDEPWRTRIVVIAYILAAMQVFATIQWHVNPLSIVLICGMALWIGRVSIRKAHPVNLQWELK